MTSPTPTPTPTPSDLLSAALDYAARGWAVLPLHTASAAAGACSCGTTCGRNAGKHPRTAHGLHDATTDDATIRRWWRQWPDASIGIATGAASGVVVVDVDGAEGERRLAELLDSREALPRSPVAHTGGGGRHFLFAAPPGGLKNSNSKIAPKIDVRGDGGYIVAPPSLHASGACYRWAVDAPLAPMPAWLLERARGALRAVAPPAPLAPPPPATDVLRRASAYLSRMDPAIAGQGGHDALFRAATAMARGFNLSHADTLSLLEREYNPRCRPPWSRRELEHKVTDAVEKATVPGGYLLDVAPPPRMGGGGQATGGGPTASAPTAAPPPPPPTVDDLLAEIRALPSPGACLEDPALLARIATVAPGSPSFLRLARELRALGVAKSALEAALRWHSRQAAERRATHPAATDDADSGAPPWAVALVRTAEGEPASVAANATTILVHDERWAGLLGWDDFRQAIAFRRPPPFHADDSLVREDGRSPDVLDDFTTVALTAWLARNYGIRLTDEVTYKAARAAAMLPGARHNSVRDYLEALTWDGVDRIGGDYPDSPPSWLARYLGTENTTYARFVGRAWLVSAIARAFDPGCKADHMLVFEGDQGVGKSTALEVLGGDYYSGSPLPLHDKDRFVNLRGVWIQNFDELASLSRSDEDAAKNFMSERRDVYRPPYGRDPVKVPRRCVFAGTLNPRAGIGYLRDETGGRRFWPVRCGIVQAVDYGALLADRDQLWAQAVTLYQEGVKWWPSTAEERALCEAEQAERQERDVWEDAVRWWLANSYVDGHLRAFVTAADVLEGALRIDPGRQEEKHNKRISSVLRAIGWRAVRPSSGGERRRGFARPSDDVGAKVDEVRRLEEGLRRARLELEIIRGAKNGADAPSDAST